MIEILKMKNVGLSQLMKAQRKQTKEHGEDLFFYTGVGPILNMISFWCANRKQIYDVNS